MKKKIRIHLFKSCRKKKNISFPAGKIKNENESLIWCFFYSTKTKNEKKIWISFSYAIENRLALRNTDFPCVRHNW